MSLAQRQRIETKYFPCVCWLASVEQVIFTTYATMHTCTQIFCQPPKKMEAVKKEKLAESPAAVG